MTAKFEDIGHEGYGNHEVIFKTQNGEIYNSDFLTVFIDDEGIIEVILNNGYDTDEFLV